MKKIISQSGDLDRLMSNVNACGFWSPFLETITYLKKIKVGIMVTNESKLPKSCSKATIFK